MYNIDIFKVNDELQPVLIKQIQVDKFFARKFFTELAKQLPPGCYKVIVEKTSFKIKEIIFKSNLVVREYIKKTRVFYIFC